MGQNVRFFRALNRFLRTILRLTVSNNVLFWSTLSYPVLLEGSAEGDFGPHFQTMIVCWCFRSKNRLLTDILITLGHKGGFLELKIDSL